MADDISLAPTSSSTIGFMLFGYSLPFGGREGVFTVGLALGLGFKVRTRVSVQG